MTIKETAKAVNEIYQEFNEYDLEDDITSAEEIAEMIAEKDYTVPQDLMEMLTSCHEMKNEEMESEILDVFNNVMMFY